MIARLGSELEGGDSLILVDRQNQQIIKALPLRTVLMIQ
jgi:hypothetical protein